MRSSDISPELVKSICDKLSEEDKKLITDRFYYQTIYLCCIIECWTNRYILDYSHAFSHSAFYEIEIIDTFNNKSM
jgi:hypothetical protein